MVKKNPGDVFSNIPNPKELWCLIQNTYDNQRDKALVATLYTTGARISEILQTKPNNYIQKENTLLIERPILKKRKKEWKPTQIPKDAYSELIMQWVSMLPKKDKVFDINRKRAWQIITRMQWESYHIWPHLLRHMRNTELDKLNLDVKERIIFMHWGAKNPAQPLSYLFREKAAIQEKVQKGAFNLEKNMQNVS